MTVVTGGGKLVAAARGDLRSPDVRTTEPTDQGWFRAGLLAGPGQEVHVVDVDDEVAELRDPVEFADRVSRGLAEQDLL
ncbi:hypothetical protein ACFV4N_07250 [Actinosynnema sp. NPDC059797]